MLECIKNTLLPMDERVICHALEHPAFGFTFDSDYRKLLPSIHGGIPKRPFFTMPNGDVRQIGWFVSYLDEESELPEPFESAFYYQENDTRIDDRSIPAILDDEILPFLDGERILPFAALFDGNEPPLTLRLYSLDSLPNDSLCFDQSQTPHSIVVCNAERATDEVLRWDAGEVEEPDFDSFIDHVADSFLDFVAILRSEP